METNPTMKFFTRREMLLAAAGLTGGALAARFYPATLVHAATPGFPQQPSAADRVAAMRAQLGARRFRRNRSRTAAIVLPRLATFRVA